MNSHRAPKDRVCSRQMAGSNDLPLGASDSACTISSASSLLAARAPAPSEVYVRAHWGASAMTAALLTDGTAGGVKQGHSERERRGPGGVARVP
jgi:hypothetical protein